MEAGERGAAPPRAGGGACELGVREICNKKEKGAVEGAVEGAEAARRRGRAGALGWGRRTPGI